jgi:hypothetical protein
LSTVKGITTILNIDDYINICLKYISYPYEEINDMIVWSMTHLLKESEGVYYAILNSNLLNEVIKASKKESVSLSFARTFTWFYSILLRVKDINNLLSFDVIKEILQIIINLIGSDDSEIITYAVWAISNVSESQYAGADTFYINSGVVQKVLKIRPYREIYSSLIGFIGEICCGEEDIVNVIYILYRLCLILTF